MVRFVHHGNVYLVEHDQGQVPRGQVSVDARQSIHILQESVGWVSLRTQHDDVVGRKIRCFGRNARSCSSGEYFQRHGSGNLLFFFMTFASSRYLAEFELRLQSC